MKLFARKLNRATALELVLQQFERAQGYAVNRSESGVLHEDENGYVIRVCYEHGLIPPRRAWFRILRGAADIQELSFEEVRQYGEQYWE